MSYVMSRISMNDIFAATFIAGAYLVYWQIWSGRWARSAWWALPLVGVLIGLAATTKWVGLYALAGLWILFMARSGFGRFLLVAVIGFLTVVAGLGAPWPFGVICVAALIPGDLARLAAPDPPGAVGYRRPGADGSARRRHRPGLQRSPTPPLSDASREVRWSWSLRCSRAVRRPPGPPGSCWARPRSCSSAAPGVHCGINDMGAPSLLAPKLLGFLAGNINDFARKYCEDDMKLLLEKVANNFPNAGSLCPVISRSFPSTPRRTY